MKYKDEIKRLKGELSEREIELKKEMDAKRIAEQLSQSEKGKNESLREKIKDMEKEIVDLSDVSKHNVSIKAAVEKERIELEGEKKTLEDKIETLEKRVVAQKASFEEELQQVKSRSKADLDSLAEKSEKKQVGTWRS